MSVTETTKAVLRTLLRNALPLIGLGVAVIVNAAWIGFLGTSYSGSSRGTECATRQRSPPAIKPNRKSQTEKAKQKKPNRKSQTEKAKQKKEIGGGDSTPPRAREETRIKKVTRHKPLTALLIHVPAAMTP